MNQAEADRAIAVTIEAIQSLVDDPAEPRVELIADWGGVPRAWTATIAKGSKDAFNAWFASHRKYPALEFTTRPLSPSEAVASYGNQADDATYTKVRDNQPLLVVAVTQSKAQYGVAIPDALAQIP